MKPQGNLIIRGGLVVDGSGGEPFEAELEILDGRIARIGSVPDGGCEVIDARGCIVTPGFVDVHTHYDGQATWSNSLAPSSWHGVTTAVMGNCGVGFAPCQPHQREMLVELMEGVEDIPHVVLDAGLPWNWRTFPEYLDALGARHFDVDIATQLPHAALRIYVMGERGARREPANPHDREQMARLAEEAMRAGAFGFSSSRALAHKSASGEAVPTLDAGEEELMAIALALKAEGKGVLQFVTDIPEKRAEGEAEFAMLRRLVERSGRPLSVNITQREKDPHGWRRMIRMVERANADGLPITGQVMGRAIGLLLGFEVTDNPFSRHPAYQELAGLPFAQRVERLSHPQLRERLLAEQPFDPEFAARCWDFGKLFEVGERPDYEPPPSDSVAQRAARLGLAPAALAYDILMRNGGTGILYRPLLNYAEGNLDAVREMLVHPNTVPGIADGGAHCGMVCDASVPTFSLTHWARDRHGARLPLPWLIRRQTADAAAMVGLRDRGRIAQGLKADINVIDHAHLQLHSPEVAYDLPGGGRRLVQRASGYVATIVSGVVTRRHGESTGALSGRLQRA
jgi:N-acyl-D-aspartate/D-glutamate deacylase